jgi:RNA polymerase sigma-70 factor (ECF subfamily)
VEATFEDVYRAHFRFVWQTLGRFGVREADLMDVTQNTFLVVHRKLPGFESRGSLRTWLFAICRGMARDYKRSARIRREVVVDFQEDPLPSAQPETQLEEMANQAVLRSLDSILEKLPEKLRAVFVLFVLDEMSGDEIAWLLQIPLGTVRSRLRLARARINGEIAAFLALLGHRPGVKRCLCS